MKSVRLIPRVRSDLRADFAGTCSKEWPRYFILALIGLVVRLPALPGEMVWDDSYLIHENPFIKSPLLIFEAFRHYLFLDSYSAHYRPVQNLSFVADYFFWNETTYGFHLTNVPAPRGLWPSSLSVAAATVRLAASGSRGDR